MTKETLKQLIEIERFQQLVPIRSSAYDLLCRFLMQVEYLQVLNLYKDKKNIKEEEILNQKPKV